MSEQDVQESLEVAQEKPKNKKLARPKNTYRLGKAKSDTLASFEPIDGFRSLNELTAEDYQALVAKVQDRDEKAAKEIYWAGRHRFVHPRDIDPSTVPSRMAVTWLEIAQSDPGKFADHVSKLLPSRQQLDIQERFQDDGRESLLALEAAIREAESSQGLHGKPEVPQAAARSSVQKPAGQG